MGLVMQNLISHRRGRRMPRCDHRGCAPLRYLIQRPVQYLMPAAAAVPNLRDAVHVNGTNAVAPTD